MWILDVASEKAVESLQLYLTSEEAVDLRASLDRLLNDPEALEHEHLFSRNGGAEMSFR